MNGTAINTIRILGITFYASFELIGEASAARLNSALSSGAPPVMSTVCTDGAVAMSSTHRCAVA